jgi:hypothetical protein
MRNLQRRVHNKNASECAQPVEEADNDARSTSQIPAHELLVSSRDFVQPLVHKQLLGRSSHAIPFGHLRLEVLHDRLLLSINSLLHHLVSRLARSNLVRLFPKMFPIQSIDDYSIEIR